MADSVEILPKAAYKISNVGPSREWKFTGNDGEVEMTTDSLQFEGHEEYWIDVNRARTSEAPKIGESLTGTVTQDEAGKYPPKFQKEKKNNGWSGGRGGGQASPGAKWASNMSIATGIVVGYYQAAGKKPESIKEFLSKIKKLTPIINKSIDGFVSESTPAVAPAKSESESGESPEPAKPAPTPEAKTKPEQVVIEDISDDDLGDW